MTALCLCRNLHSMAECKNDHVLLRSYNELQHSNEDVSQTSERQDLGPMCRAQKSDVLQARYLKFKIQHINLG